MVNNNRNNLIYPPAENNISKLKFEVTDELGMPSEVGLSQVNDANYNNFLDNLKQEVAQELGLTKDINSRGWAEMTSRECGLVGGNMGGKIGGNMVKKMVRFAEDALVKKYSK